MSLFWKEYNIFISSTFKDMDAERDAIKHFVIPRLNRRYRPYCISFYAVDLRFGVNTQNLCEEDSENMVLSACFSKIDSSRPFFIGLLGERYGWIPDNDRLDYIISTLADDKKCLLEDGGGCSVTELEILYGALGGDGNNINRSLFFFRDEDSYRNIPDELKPDYKDICNNALSDTDIIHLTSKLSSLKSKIRDACSRRMLEHHCEDYHLDWDLSKNSYYDMSNFINLVYQRLCLEIDKEIGQCKESISWYDVERETAMYLIHNSQKCVVNDRILNNVIVELQSSSRVAVIGSKGMGKTTLLSQLSLSLSSDPQTIVLLAYPEISPYTDTVENILFYWGIALQSLLGMERLDETILTSKNSYTILYDTFYTLIDKVRATGYKVIAMIDGYEALLTGRDMLWLDDSIPLLVTGEYSIQGFSNITFDKNSVDIDQILTNHENRHNIALPDQVRQSILSRGTLPVDVALFSAMFTNLATVDFKQLRKKRAASEISKLNDYVASVYENTPKSSDRLFVYALNFLLERLGALSLWKAVEYISISEEGLRLSDLAVLLGEDWCELKFFVLMELMGDFFLENPVTKQWKLCNDGFRKAILLRTDRQDELKLLRILDSYDDEDPVKRSLLLRLAVSSHSTDVTRKYLIGFYLGDINNIWYTNESVILLTRASSFLDLLAGVLSELNSEEKVSIVYSLCNVLYMSKRLDIFTACVRQLDYVDVSSLDLKVCYTLAYLYRDTYLVLKYDNDKDEEAFGYIMEKTIDCYYACNNIMPGYKDTVNMYNTMLIEYASYLSARGEYDKAYVVFSKI